jgi:hypothetical protein
LKLPQVLKDAMEALTARKPITLTTTAMCSGTFAARIARSQRLRELRITGSESSGWGRPGNYVEASRLKAYGLDVRATISPDAEAAIAALSDGLADVAFTDSLTAVRARARNIPVQFITIIGGMENGYVALASVIDAKGYAMARLARALRENIGANYVDARALQALIDRFAAEKLVERAVTAGDLISSVAIMSGTK